MILLIAWCWAIVLIIAFWENGREREYKIMARAREIKVCVAAHRKLAVCMEGCEHAGPHYCTGNDCLEHKTSCISAGLYGYNVTNLAQKDLPTVRD